MQRRKLLTLKMRKFVKSQNGLVCKIRFDFDFTFIQNPLRLQPHNFTCMSDSRQLQLHGRQELKKIPVPDV